ncbi:MAG: site-2 protease family protein [bacterium]|nr:site-2 protease family protein [bacterium]
MDIILAILKIMLGFAIIIGVHELGHGVAATLVGVKIKKFSLGMGPGFKFKNVPWLNEVVISPIVIGGYVMLDDEALEQKSFWQKTFVSFGGMLSNVMCAIIILICLGWPILNAVSLSLTIWLGGWLIFIRGMNSGEVTSNDMAGPVAIGQMLAGTESATAGMPYWFIVAFLSLAIAMFNLLPMPPLDGGRIIMDMVKLIFEPVKARVINTILALTGTILLLTLLIWVVFNDISKL